MIPMKCVGCGATLEIELDMDVFACGYCGTNQTLEKKGGTVALRNIQASLQQVQQGTDKTASELAVARLKGELNELEIERQNLLQLEANRLAKELEEAAEGSGVILFLLLFASFASVGVIGWWSILCFIGSIAIFKNFGNSDKKKRSNQRVQQIQQDIDRRLADTTKKLQEHLSKLE